MGTIPGVNEFWRHIRSRRGLAVLGLVAVLAAVGWMVSGGYRQQARLLLGDPDLLPENPALMAFALPRGARVFSAHCAACHGPGGQGDSSIGAANLTDQDWLYGEGMVGEIAQTVAYGIRSRNPRGRDLAAMPAYARPVPYDREKLPPLSPGDIRDVVAFLLTQQGRPTNVGDPGRGLKIFQGRGGCWDCHGGDGRGDSEIGAPNLLDHIWLYGTGSPQDVFHSIADDHAGICPAWAGRLTPAEVMEVSLYVWSLSHERGHS